MFIRLLRSQDEWVIIIIMDNYEKASNYIDIGIFVIVFIAQASVFIIRKFKLDFASILTLLLYLIVIFIRFLRALISGDNRLGAVQVGINIVCHQCISMTMYHFVFEMKAVLL